MSDCCTPGAGFPTASLMQQMATNNSVIWEEICKLQQAIMTASSQCQPGGGQMCTTVGGDTPMTYVTGVSNIAVVSPGAGYFQDTPAIAFIPPNGRDTTAIGATAALNTNGGNIIQVNIATAGTGYQPVSSVLTVSSLSGTNAILLPLVNAAGQIVGINIVSSGLGYTLSDTVVPTRADVESPYYVNATFRIAAVGTLGEILAVSLTNPGSGYQDSRTTVKIVSSLNPLMPYPLGTGFVASVLTDEYGALTEVVIINTGYGYTSYSPYLVISDPGTGASTKVHLTGDAVSYVEVINPGSNYTPTATATIFNPPTGPAPTAQAQLIVNVSNSSFGTNPNLYYQVWAGLATDKQISTQINAVLSYFKQLGYTITVQANPATTNTIVWRLCW